MKKILLLLFFVPLCAFAEEPLLSHIVSPRGETNPLTDNKNTVETFYSAMVDNDQKTMSKLLAPNYQVQDSNVVFDSSFNKYDAFSKNINVRMTHLQEAFPKFEAHVSSMIAEGNKVFARIQISGVQRGSFLGVEPTNKPVIIKIFTIFTFEGGKITHINEVWNELGVMKQLGYIVL